MNTHKPQILIVDDEAPIRKVLRKCFESELYQVFEADNRQSTVDALSEHAIDLITLDVNLDGDDGLALAREIRSTSNVPIIMVSGKGDLIDTVVGLEVGADDYIRKPFELREVLARAKSALRRSQLNAAIVTPSSTTRKTAPENGKLLCFDNCVLSSASRDLTASDGTRFDLTTSEYNLLQLLASHAQQVLSRDQIIDKVKGTDWNPTDRTVDNQIARLRKKLNDVGISHAIKTVRGTGYQFTRSVELRHVS